MALDFEGNIVSIVQIIALLLLIVGVYPYKIRVQSRNLLVHGFLSILALALNLATVFYTMIPGFSGDLAEIGELPVLQSAVVWLHLATGIAAIVLGFAIVLLWLTRPLGELGCSRAWRLMIPTFLIWAFALALGLTIHIFDII